jgi:hypothetical protein
LGPEFNKELDYELLARYKKIIFSSCGLNNDLFDKYLNNSVSWDSTYTCLKFNQKVDTQ